MFRVLTFIMVKDLKAYGARSGECSMPLLFFVMIVSIFPFALGPDNTQLLKIAPAIIWMAVILCLLMSLTAVFQVDYQEGIIEQYVLSPYPLSLIIFGKSIVHILILGIPLWILAMFSGLCLQMSTEALGVLGISLALGIPTLSLMGTLMAALTLGLSQGGVLLSVLALPLMVPVIIFGSSGVQAASQGMNFNSEILLLTAFWVAAWALGPFLVAAAIKTSLE